MSLEQNGDAVASALSESTEEMDSLLPRTSRGESSQMLLMKPDVEPTGDSRIDAALDRMRDVADLPTSEHVEVFDEVHRRMQELLADSSQ